MAIHGGEQYFCIITCLLVTLQKFQEVFTNVGWVLIFLESCQV